MARPDWVPCFNWMDGLNVSANTVANFPLMDPSRYGAAVTDLEGVIEEDSGRYFVERIVGSITLFYPGPANNPIAFVRIWPAFIQSNQSVIVAGALGPGSVGAANSRFWYDNARFITENFAWEDHESLAHPAWSHIDIRPKQVCEQNIMPCLSIENEDLLEDLTVVMRLRLLVKPLRR